MKPRYDLMEEMQKDPVVGPKLKELCARLREGWRVKRVKFNGRIYDVRAFEVTHLRWEEG